MMRSRLLIALSLVLAACPAVSTTRDNAQSGNDSLAGTWRGYATGLSVLLTLQQAGDSVSGSGTFEVAQNASIGCGGETLPPSGTVTIGGKLQANQFQGRMTFANIWTPPYLGTRSRADSLVGHFMSVDRGGCPLVLVRQH